MGRARVKRKHIKPGELPETNPVPVDYSARQIRKVPKAIRDQRVDIILQLRLAGAKFQDIRDYAQTPDHDTGRPWHLSDRGLRRYMDRADKLVEQYRDSNRERLLDYHVAATRALRFEATKQGHLETALATLKHEGRLQGLPEQDNEGQGNGRGAGAVPANVTLTANILVLPPAERSQAILAGAVPTIDQLLQLTEDERARIQREMLEYRPETQ